MANSSIEWTDRTWNPVTGCNKVSPGCKHCYAEVMAHRLNAMGQANYRNGFKLTLQPQMLDAPLRWRKPGMVFVNSMSDLFHDNIALEYIQQVFAVMRKANWHQYQILTKRSERLLRLSPDLDWMPHVWMGVSVENSDYTSRIDDLRKTGAHVKFVSAEPLLGPLPDLDLCGIDWLIAGHESGHGARPAEEGWVRDIKDQCIAQGTAFFYKQAAKNGRKLPLPVLDGRQWMEMPTTA